MADEMRAAEARIYFSSPKCVQARGYSVRSACMGSTRAERGEGVALAIVAATATFADDARAELSAAYPTYAAKTPHGWGTEALCRRR